MFHYLLIAFETSREAETRQLGLEVMAREAELKALRAQIDPHFLFNSLHSVSALTGTDPDGARRMCMLLADFFRSSVRLGAKDQIRLEEEIEMVRQYLEIEKVRFGDRLVSDLDMQAESATCLVPPLILQPLVENSVRHGIHARVQGGVVRILARRDSGDLHLSIENPVDATTPGHAGTGVGLANVRRRLETRFGNQSSTRVVRPDGLFRVEIRMPCMEDPKGGPTHEPGP
jgi:two-component system sensor histidine kinase AlgZ